MSDAVILLVFLALVFAFFFFLINRDVRKVEKDYIAKQRKEKKKSRT